MFYKPLWDLFTISMRRQTEQLNVNTGAQGRYFSFEVASLRSSFFIPAINFRLATPGCRGDGRGSAVYTPHPALSACQRGRTGELRVSLDVTEIPAFVCICDHLLKLAACECFGNETHRVHCHISQKKKTSLLYWSTWIYGNILQIFQLLMSYETYLSQQRSWQHWFAMSCTPAWSSPACISRTECQATEEHLAPSRYYGIQRELIS